MTVATIVLATGSSSSVGIPRHLALVDGRPLVRHVVEAAVSSSSDAVAVVVGPHAERVERALAGLEIVQLPNPRWIEGGASSIRAGIAWADAQGFDAVTLVSADRNRATAEHLDAIVRLHRRGHPVVATRHCGVLGLPAVFGRTRFGDLMTLLGDRGAADVIATAESVASVELGSAPAKISEPPRSRVRAQIKRTRARAGR